MASPSIVKQMEDTDRNSVGMDSERSGFVMKMSENLRGRGDLDEIEEKENDDSAMSPDLYQRKQHDSDVRTGDDEVTNSEEEESKVIIPTAPRRTTFQTVKSQVTAKTEVKVTEIDHIDYVSDGNPYDKDWVDNVEIRLKPDWMDVLAIELNRKEQLDKVL